MKQQYPNPYLSLLFIVLFLMAGLGTNAQCPEGATPGSTAYDTTIKIPSGVYNTSVKFPQFDPEGGMITCVRLCVTIIGVIDSVAIENNGATPSTFNVRYRREDELSGPGFTSPNISNSINYTSPNINLGGTDGVLNSGPDFHSNVHDTVLRAEICRTINGTLLEDFYGEDSMEYNYSIDVMSYVQGLNGSFNSSIATSALVNFRFEYCTCPGAVLPLNIRNFDVSKLTSSKAELKWHGFDDPFADYHYEVELSKNTDGFVSIGSFPKNAHSASSTYSMLFEASNGESGLHFFRVKQVYKNGYVRYSNTRQVMLEKSGPIKFSLYPNPSDGIVGIKFDNNYEGQFNIQIYNTQGQVVMKKDVVVSNSSYIKVADLRSGVYWLRLTDKKSQMTCVNQLFIK